MMADLVSSTSSLKLWTLLKRHDRAYARLASGKPVEIEGDADYSGVYGVRSLNGVNHYTSTIAYVYDATTRLDADGGFLSLFLEPRVENDTYDWVVKEYSSKYLKIANKLELVEVIDDIIHFDVRDDPDYTYEGDGDTLGFKFVELVVVGDMEEVFHASFELKVGV
jgi:hypothetical protein